MPVRDRGTGSSRGGGKGTSVNSYRAVFAAACVGMLLFGVTVTTLGSVLPPLVRHYGLSDADAGSLLARMPLGILAASLLFGPVVDRYGYRLVFVAGTLAVGIGLGTIAWAPDTTVLAPAMLLFGFGGGLLNGATNALVADITPEGRGSGLSLLGAFFGIGALSVPFLLGLLLARGISYTAITAALALLVLLPLIDFLVVGFPTPKQAQGFPLRRVGALLGNSTLLLIGFLLFLQSGMEITLGGWSAQYVHKVLELGEESSIMVLSLFWVGMTLARFVLTWLLRFLAPTSVFPAFLVIALAGAALLLAVQSPVAAGLGLFLLGAGLASGFPILLGLLGGRFQDLTGTAFSAVLVMALVGASTLSYLTGVVGGWYGLRTSLIVVPLALVLQAGLFFVLRRQMGPSPSTSDSSQA